ncbi:hypothetical protein [Ammoniphilus sp. 3BR4]
MNQIRFTSLMLSKQNLYLIPGDVHPNADGQALLAQLAIDLIP